MVIAGTRTPVKVLFENIEAGSTIDEIMDDFALTSEWVDTVMAFVVRSLELDGQVVPASVSQEQVAA